MHQEEHYGAALLAYAPLGAVLAAIGGQQPAVLGLVTVAALAMVPDQDQRIPRITHRGITHTVWFALVIGLAVGLAGAYVGNVLSDGAIRTIVLAGGFGFVVGTLSILSHIAADALTPMGVTPFIPVDDRHYTLDVVRASNDAANYLLLVAGTAASGLVLVLPTLL